MKNGKASVLQKTVPVIRLVQIIRGIKKPFQNPVSKVGGIVTHGIPVLHGTETVWKQVLTPGYMLPPWPTKCLKEDLLNQQATALN